MGQTTTISQGTELLFTLFFWQPKKLGKGEECFDFFTYFFWRWTCKEKDIPNDQDLKWIYGEFLWKDKLVEVLEEDYFDAGPEDFNVDVREYRLKALKKIIWRTRSVLLKRFIRGFLYLWWYFSIPPALCSQPRMVRCCNQKERSYCKGARKLDFHKSIQSQ